MTGEERGEDPRSAEEVYEDFLRRRDTEGLPFEAFLEGHPGRAEALRALHSLHERPGERMGDGGPAPLSGAPGPENASLAGAIEAYARGAEGKAGGPGLEGGDSIDRFRIISVLGEGGFGVVYRAEEQEPVRRIVALKVLKPGMDSRAVVARFEAERQALALMNHSSIAQVFEAGATRLGRPFFAMEYIAGIPITDYCERHDLPIRKRLDLFLPVCEAVQHAHQKAVIHRDLKPSNVLVMVEGGRPLPKIIDFGVAKATARPLTEKTLFTEMGQMIGTPAYMSPEQAEMSGLDVDTRTDIYSLGVILYEVLTGVLPFDPQVFRRSGYSEIQRILREEEPLRPSSRIAKADVRPDGDDGRRLRALRGQLRGDLDWIVMKAMAKDRIRRYASASELAADIRRHLDDEPVLAGPPGIGYRMRKLVRKHRTAAAVLLTVAVSLAVLAGALAWRSEAAYRGSLAAVRSALEARDLVGARAALSVLLDSHPERREVKDLSGRVKSLDVGLRAEESAAILEKARKDWAGYLGRKAEHRDIEARWREERLRQKSWLPPWERGEEEARLEEKVGLSRKEVEDLYHGALAGFGKALETAPEGTEASGAARKAFALVHRELSEIAEREGGVTFGAEYFRMQGASLAPSLFERRTATIGIELEPADAEVHCFRYVESERRLVPLPFRPEAGERPEEGLPLIVEEVPEPGRSPFRAGDRLLRVGGKEVRTWGDLARAIEGLALGAAVTIEIARDGEVASVSWVPFPADSSRAAGDGAPWRPGQLISIREQLGFTLAAYPLVLDGRSRVTPSAAGRLEARLPEGSYLLVARMAGRVEGRYPVRISGEDRSLRLKLFREDEVPPGFVPIPAGPFSCGGDVESFQGMPFDEVTLGDFFMGRLEVTFREYIEFLNDPLNPIDERGESTPAAEDVLPIAKSLKRDTILLVPKLDSGDPLARRPLAGGKWAPTDDVESDLWPVFGVSQLAAREYAHWLTIRKGGGRWRFRLPKDIEWEKAARGVDRRRFVWGDAPVWSYAWTNRGIPWTRKRPERVGASPADESAYGVRDLTGSVSEHALGQPAPPFRYGSIRGGNWFNTDEIWGRIATRNGLLPENTARNTGFRLAAEPAR